jgi:hypothetical protein
VKGRIQRRRPETKGFDRWVPARLQVAVAQIWLALNPQASCSLQEYFAAMATVIQRFWRGFWSRKYVFDFHARKLYLQRIAQINTQVRMESCMVC